MHFWRVGVVFATGLCLLTGATGPASAQEAVSVSITGTHPGIASQGCTAGPTLVVIPPQFVLTRTGDTTDALEVAISWGGEIALETTVSPIVAEFAAGSATTEITPVFASVPTEGTLTLTVEAGAGYQPGDPATVSATFNIAEPLCVAPPLPPAPPPIAAEPSFTG